MKRKATEHELDEHFQTPPSECKAKWLMMKTTRKERKKAGLLDVWKVKDTVYSDNWIWVRLHYVSFSVTSPVFFIIHPHPFPVDQWSSWCFLSKKKTKTRTEFPCRKGTGAVIIANNCVGIGLEGLSQGEEAMKPLRRLFAIIGVNDAFVGKILSWKGEKIFYCVV